MESDDDDGTLPVVEHTWGDANEEAPAADNASVYVRNEIDQDPDAVDLSAQATLSREVNMEHVPLVLWEGVLEDIPEPISAGMPQYAAMLRVLQTYLVAEGYATYTNVAAPAPTHDLFQGPPVLQALQDTGLAADVAHQMLLPAYSPVHTRLDLDMESADELRTRYNAYRAERDEEAETRFPSFEQLVPEAVPLKLITAVTPEERRQRAAQKKQQRTRAEKEAEARAQHAEEEAMMNVPVHLPPRTPPVVQEEEPQVVPATVQEEEPGVPPVPVAREEEEVEPMVVVVQEEDYVAPVADAEDGLDDLAELARVEPGHLMDPALARAEMGAQHREVTEWMAANALAPNELTTEEASDAEWAAMAAKLVTLFPQAQADNRLLTKAGVQTLFPSHAVRLSVFATWLLGYEEQWQHVPASKAVLLRQLIRPAMLPRAFFLWLVTAHQMLLGYLVRQVTVRAAVYEPAEHAPRRGHASKPYLRKCDAVMEPLHTQHFPIPDLVMNVLRAPDLQAAFQALYPPALSAMLWPAQPQHHMQDDMRALEALTAPNGAFAHLPTSRQSGDDGIYNDAVHWRAVCQHLVRLYHMDQAVAPALLLLDTHVTRAKLETPVLTDPAEVTTYWPRILPLFWGVVPGHSKTPRWNSFTEATSYWFAIPSVGLGAWRSMVAEEPNLALVQRALGPDGAALMDPFMPTSGWHQRAQGGTSSYFHQQSYLAGIILGNDVVWPLVPTALKARLLDEYRRHPNLFAALMKKNIVDFTYPRPVYREGAPQ